MNKELFSVSEISEILGLHPKTVQRFIREGTLKGRKIGRAWKVHVDDLKEYSHAELSTPRSGSASVGRTASAGVNAEPLPGRLVVSAVIEIRNSSEEESSRISNSLVAVLNSKDPAWGKTRYDYIYQPETGTARFILYGSPKFISGIMKLLGPLAEEE